MEEKHKKIIKIIIIITLIILAYNYCSEEGRKNEEARQQYKLAEKQAQEAFDRERNTKHDFKPSQIIFEYNDHNTTTYKGDTGLLGGYWTNKLTNKTYKITDNTIRGIAYATKGTFKFKENLDIKETPPPGEEKNSKIVEIFYKNGTEIQSLSLFDEDLTVEQRKYFDNYTEQKMEHDTEISRREQESLIESQNRILDRSNSRHHSYYWGPGGGGYIYTP